MKTMRRGPIVAKTYEDVSWSSIQSMVSKAHKIRWILNVFGVYDHTNNKMWTHGYKQKTRKQFLDFIKRVDQKCDCNIKQMFLVLVNIWIHKSNSVKDTILRYYPSIYLVFLPTWTLELNLIEAKWIWMHRQAIYNTTFRNDMMLVKQ